jgi:catechol 2,3-dioxygenase-like lactoylglutathione lyase family enzyme
VTEPAMQGFHHVQLAMPAGKEDAAERFYAGLLGLERVPKPAELEARGGAWFRSADVEVHLGVELDFRPARKAHPAFLVDGLDELRDRLRAAGVETVDDTQLQGHQRFYASDPFGNRLEFIERD